MEEDNCSLVPRSNKLLHQLDRFYSDLSDCSEFRAYILIKVSGTSLQSQEQQAQIEYGCTF